MKPATDNWSKNGSPDQGGHLPSGTPTTRLDAVTQTVGMENKVPKVVDRSNKSGDVELVYIRGSARESRGGKGCRGKNIGKTFTPSTGGRSRLGERRGESRKGGCARTRKKKRTCAAFLSACCYRKQNKATVYFDWKAFLHRKLVKPDHRTNRGTCTWTLVPGIQKSRVLGGKKKIEKKAITGMA